MTVPNLSGGVSISAPPRQLPTVLAQHPLSLALAILLRIATLQRQYGVMTGVQKEWGGGRVFRDETKGLVLREGQLWGPATEEWESISQPAGEEGTT